MDKIYGYVYKIVCKIDGKLYIGQTIRSISERWRSHCNDSKKRSDKDKLYISRAISKHGIDNFEISIVCKANNREELNNREKTAIKLYRSIENGYNIHEGGLNQRLSAATKMKISLGNKGKKRTKEQKENYRKARLGTKQPISVKIKCSTSQLGEKSAWWGKKHSESTKAKISIGNRGKVVTEESKKKMSEAKKGKRATKEAKLKMSIARKGKKPNQKSIVCITNGQSYVSIKDAAASLSISISSLCHHLRGNLKTAQGFVFRYA